jgi:hypothetical protein
MRKCIAAHTNPGVEYPGYINFTRNDDGTVTVFLRGDPKKIDGGFVCGQAGQKGQAGRCTPGDDNCNNYCNLAPQKGPMQAHPLSCSHMAEGVNAMLTLKAEAFDAFIASVHATPK